MAERFLDEKTTGVYGSEVSVPANQRLKPISAAILISGLQCCRRLPSPIDEELTMGGNSWR